MGYNPQNIRALNSALLSGIKIPTVASSASAFRLYTKTAVYIVKLMCNISKAVKHCLLLECYDFSLDAILPRYRNQQIGRASCRERV